MTAATEDISEEIAEEIGKIPEIAKILKTAPGSATHSRKTEAVVGLAFLGVRQDRVGLGGLLEALLGRRVVLVAVGMIRQRLRAVRRF